MFFSARKSKDISQTRKLFEKKLSIKMQFRHYNPEYFHILRSFPKKIPTFAK